MNERETEFTEEQQKSAAGIAQSYYDMLCKMSWFGVSAQYIDDMVADIRKYLGWAEAHAKLRDRHGTEHTDQKFIQQAINDEAFAAHIRIARAIIMEAHMYEDMNTRRLLLGNLLKDHLEAAVTLSPLAPDELDPKGRTPNADVIKTTFGSRSHISEQMIRIVSSGTELTR